jgi:hypothetical protein
LEVHGFASTADAARKLLAEIDAAERASQPSLPPTEPSPPPAEPLAKAKPAPDVPSPAPVPLRSAEEIRFDEAMRPIDAFVVAWNFQPAVATLSGLSFGEPELAARLTVRRDEVQRLVLLKARMIATINTAQPRVDKMALLLRGINGELTQADEQGLTATLVGGKTEAFAWTDLNERSRQKLLQLVVNRDSGDDWLAAGAFASAFGDEAAERFFAQAQTLGKDVNPYLSARAASGFSQARRLLEEGKFAEADEALVKLEERYSKTSWFTTHQPAVAAARAAAKAGRPAAGADRLPP